MNKELKTSFEILKNIYFNNAYLNIELNKVNNKNINFKLITKIVYGVTQNDVMLEYFLQQFFKKSPKKQVKLLLKIAAYLKFNINSIPNFAITNELVNIAKGSELKPYAGFINATIKNILTTDLTLPQKNTNLYYSIKYSKPIWFIELLINQYGNMFEEILQTNLKEQTHIRINNVKIETENFLKELDNAKIEYSCSMLPNAIYVDYEKLNKVQELNNLYTPQGVTSMIVALNASGQLVLDSCSAPGGKAIYYATLNPKSKVVACDIHEHRLNLISSYKNLMGVNNIELKNVDATIFNPEFADKFDCVILDVPCSGLGVINKKPDILLHFSEQSLIELPKLQLKILENNCKYVKNGGYIVYSTCTINKEENEKVLEQFLNNHKNFKEANINTFEISSIGQNFKTFLPNVSNTEGFFIGRICRHD